MLVTLQMTNLPAGSQIGPLFNVISLPSGSGASPSQITLTELLNGIPVDVPDGTTTITVQSTGTCKNSVNVPLPQQSTTTSSTSTSTTSTTTINICGAALCGETYEGYGYLYNWYAAIGVGFSIVNQDGRDFGGIVNVNQPYNDQRNQWVVPSDLDLQQLIQNDPTGSNGNLRTICTSPFTTNNGVWNTPNTAATNTLNFAAVPAGARSAFDGQFAGIGENTIWWSRTESSTPGFAEARGITYFASTSSGNRNKKFGFSIRLVRPATLAEQALPDGTTSNDNSLLPHYVGNSRTYITVKIGNQVWTAQNLMDEQYNDGTPILEVTSNTAWNTLTTGARCSYNNGSITPDEGQIALCGVPI